MEGFQFRSTLPIFHPTKEAKKAAHAKRILNFSVRLPIQEILI
jgi:hypothetical protein